jgi:hypothetical protein
VAHLDEHRLLGNLREGDPAAAEELVHRVAGDGWLLALVVQQRAELATDLATRAIVRTLADAVDGRLTSDATFRAAALRTVRDQSLARRISVSDGSDLTGSEALACFGQLAEPSRSALLLADILLLPDDQLGHPLDLPDEEARTLADRAGAALRQRLAHRLGGRTGDECRAALERAAAQVGHDDTGEADLHLAGCAVCRENQDLLVGAVDHVREALPVPPEDLDAHVLEAWAGLLSARSATANGYPAAPDTLLRRFAAAGPAARRTVAAAAAAVLVAGLVAVGAGSGPRPAPPVGTAVAGASTTALTEPSPAVSAGTSTSAPTTTTTPGATAAVAPDTALTAQLLHTLTTASTTASIPAAGGSGAGSGSAGNSVQPTNVGSPTPANPATPSAPSTTAPPPAPATTTAPTPTTTAPAPTTTTNPLQPVVDLVNKVLHP